MSLPLLTIAALVALQAAPASTTQDPTAALTEGIKLIEAGDLDQAAQRLEAAVEALAVRPDRGRELATAHVYLAMAQLGRGQLERARVHMREAWVRRKGARLDPRTFPPRVIGLYEEIGATMGKRRSQTPALIGVGAAAASAGAAVGAALTRSSPAAAPAPRSEARTVRLYNIDDSARAWLNGQLLTEVGLGQDSGPIDITNRLSSGQNEIVFELINDHGAISYAFEVRVGDAIVFQESCGLVLRVGCENDRKFEPGVVKRFVYTLAGR